MTLAYIVGAEGQVVIAREIRERLGVKPGWVAVQRLVGDRARESAWAGSISTFSQVKSWAWPGWWAQVAPTWRA